MASLWLEQSFETFWDRLLPLLGRTISQEDCRQLQEKLDIFYTTLCRENEQVNLTRLTSSSGFLSRHILDSLLLSACIPEGARVIDIGSGAGFPVLPLALFRPDLKLTAVEATQKKARFISEMVDLLALTQTVRVVDERAELLAHQSAFREQFDVVTARAVAALPTLLELCTPFARVSGRLVLPKGPKANEELEASKRALSVLNLVVQDVSPHTVNCYEADAHETVIVQLQKQGRTPQQYPRPAGKPVKQPL